jgi:tRNA/rRNA methyltransferase
MSDELSVNELADLAPAIILVEPQLGENIGAAARAMANFGLTDLRLVAPRDGWPNEKAIAAASRADHVINGAQVFDNADQAVADLVFVYATTARNRDIPKAVSGPRAAAHKLRERASNGQKTGLLFGRERWGLENEEINLADEIVTFPVNPQFASLNIAQSVLLIAYEWMASGLEEGGLLPTRNPMPELDDMPSSKAHLFAFIQDLEAKLDEADYFKAEELRPSMHEKLWALFQRPGFTKLEVDVLRGVVAALEGRRQRRMAAGAKRRPGGNGDA